MGTVAGTRAGSLAGSHVTPEGKKGPALRLSQPLAGTLLNGTRSLSNKCHNVLPHLGSPRDAVTVKTYIGTFIVRQDSTSRESRDRDRSEGTASTTLAPTPTLSESASARNFAPSGLLAAATNTVKNADGTSTLLEYNEPPEARKPLDPTCSRARNNSVSFVPNRALDSFGV